MLIREKNHQRNLKQNVRQFQQTQYCTLTNHSMGVDQDSQQSIRHNAQTQNLPHAFQKNKIKVLILIMVIVSASILCLQFIVFSNNKTIDNNSRLLQKDSFGQVSINVKTINDVPRWINYVQNHEETIKPQLNNVDQNKIDISQIIFDAGIGLESELTAGITRYKYLLGQKLLQLNIAPSNKYAKGIYDFQRKYYQDKYEISKYQELPICVIVPTYNNVPNQRYRLNLESIAKQQYQNYKVIIIDDASTDQTSSLLKELISQKGLNTTKYKLIENKSQMKALNNIRKAAISFCSPKDIMIIVDGDDQLVGRQVFKLFNAVFQKEQVWFAYSNFIDILTRNIGYSRPYQPQVLLSNSYRYQPFYTSHLRAFYVQLFLKIKQQDLQDQNGKYYQAANDVAICIPILEMSSHRVKYIPQLTYGYNSNTGINNHIIRTNQQQTNNRQIRFKKSYPSLQHLIN